jgi:hypothetical protein
MSCRILPFFETAPKTRRTIWLQSYFPMNHFHLSDHEKRPRIPRIHKHFKICEMREICGAFLFLNPSSADYKNCHIGERIGVLGNHSPVFGIESDPLMNRDIPVFTEVLKVSNGEKSDIRGVIPLMTQQS